MNLVYCAVTLEMMFTGICVIVAVFGLQVADCGVSKQVEEYVPIKYPGPIQEVTQNRYGSDDVPEECKNKNFCTIKPPDYPQDQFNQMFKGTKPLPQPTLIIESVADRQGGPEQIDNCESTISYEPLYKVRSKRGDWRTVVQAPEENYVQMVRLETCQETEGGCFTALPPSPEIVTFCKQKFSVWEFLVASENNGTEKVKTELPICCSCHYKFVL